MGNKHIMSLLLVAVSLFLLLSTARAEDEIPDKFKFAIGGYALARFESTISLTSPDLGAGISISPQDTLGMNIDTSVLRIDGHYRFNRKHALTYSWYSINTEGNKSIEEEFQWTDPDGITITIPVGAQVTSKLDYDIFKVGYLWSFYHTDKVELSLGGGLHITRVALGLDASVTNPPSSAIEQVDTTVPLPVIAVDLKYHVTPKFHWYLKSELFAIKFDKWAGSYRDTTFGLEYRAWKNVAIGGGLSGNALEIEEDDPKARLKFTNTITGGLLYVATYF